MAANADNINIIAGASQSTRVNPGESLSNQRITRIVVSGSGKISQLTENIFDQSSKGDVSIDVIGGAESPDYGQNLMGQNIAGIELNQGDLLVPRRNYFSYVASDSATLICYLELPLTETTRIKP